MISYCQYVNQNSDGQIEETESISTGLDYPGISPLHCFLKDVKRARYTAASDEEALKAYQIVTKYENLRPSLEPSHAFSVAIKEAKRLSKDTIVIINSCGDAYKDRGILEKKLGNRGTHITSFGKELLKKYLKLCDHLSNESQEFINWAASKQTLK